MKIIVYFTLGDVLECADVRDTRRFWRKVSKHCKWFSNTGALYGKNVQQRVERVEIVR